MNDQVWVHIKCYKGYQVCRANDVLGGSGLWEYFWKQNPPFGTQKHNPQTK